MARGIERHALFLDDDDRSDFLERLARVILQGGARLYAWCLMPNHFHLLVRTTDRPLARNMRRLMTGYAAGFNRRRRRCGYPLQNRYKSIVAAGGSSESQERPL